MHYRTGRMLMITLTVMAFVMSAAVACGGDDDVTDDIGDTVGTVTNGDDDTPSSGTTPDSTEPGTTPGAGGGQTTPEGGGGEGGVIEIESENTEFSKDELQATAGAFTIRHENLDDAVVHNLAIYESEDDTSEPLFATELEPGPTTQELEVNLDAGEYYYQCDSHPDEMNGTLTVE